MYTDTYYYSWRPAKAELLESLGKGQLGLIAEMGSMNSFPLEIAFESVKYNFQAPALPAA